MLAIAGLSGMLIPARPGWGADDWFSRVWHKLKCSPSLHSWGRGGGGEAAGGEEQDGGEKRGANVGE